MFSKACAMASSIDDNCSNPIHTERRREGNRTENLALIPRSSYSKNNICSISALLPEDILILIVNKLDVVGFHRFSAACRFLRSVAAAAKKIRHQIQVLPKPQFPWLMLSFNSWKRGNTFKDLLPHHHPYDHDGFFSAFHGKIYRLGMTRLRHTRCCGSNWGWLIMLNQRSGSMFLLNPFTGVRIELPNTSTLPCPIINMPIFRPDIRKVILLSPAAVVATTTDHTNSNSNRTNNNNNAVVVDDCLVLVLYRRNLVAFCRPGDKAWTAFTKHYVDDKYLRYQDFIVQDGKLYAIKYNYDLVLMELGLDQPKETSCNIVTPPVEQLDNPPRMFRHLYLVECRGELLMVIRWIRLDYIDVKVQRRSKIETIQRTVTLKIFKLEKQQYWVEVEELGDQMLFVGVSTGFSRSALDCPGFRGNCLYFTDGCFSPYHHDLGVFHLEDKSVKTFYRTPPSGLDKFLPIWFAPISW